LVGGLKTTSYGVHLSSIRQVAESLGKSYRQARYLGSVARSRWFSDTARMFDEISVARAWDYNSQLEQERYARVLAKIDRLRGPDWGSALELGCHDGIFTRQLADRCREVVACDISSDACQRTRSRCEGLSQVRVQPVDVETQDIDGKFDLIFAMDILNYVYGRDKMLRTSATLAAAMKPSGILVITDCRLAPYIRDAWFRYLVPVGGDNIADLFAMRPEWKQVEREFHPDSGEDLGPQYMAHVIAMFTRTGA